MFLFMEYRHGLIDAVITENFQADVYKKAKKLIPQIKELKIYRLKDIRMVD